MKALTGLIFFLATSPLFATEVTIIKNPDGTFTGYSEVMFSENTSLKIAKYPESKIYIDSYKGWWSNGAAEGTGILTGRYVIPGLKTDSPNLAEKGQADAILARAEGNAKFNGDDPAKAVAEVLADKHLLISYSGEFKAGAPQGRGEIEVDTHQVKGFFINWLLEGEATTYFQGLPIITEGFSDGVPGAGPVIVNQYKDYQLARVFVGERTGSAVSGDFYNVQWSLPVVDYTTTGIGNVTTTEFSDGRRLHCTFHDELVGLSKPSDLDVFRGNVLIQPRIFDPKYLNSPKRCLLRRADGWSFGYPMLGSGVFGSKALPPDVCADPKGRSGRLEPNKYGELDCSIYESKYKWLTHFGKKIEEGSRWVRDIILDPINATGDALAGTMCDVVQKKKGVDCHISIYYEKKFELVSEKDKSEARSKEYLDKFLANRKALDEKLADNKSDPWLQAAYEIWKDCASSCDGPAKAYSMLSVSALADMLKSDFDEQVKSTRIASIFEQAKKWKPVVEHSAAIYKGYKIGEVISNAQYYIVNAEPPKKTKEVGKLAAVTYLNDLSIRVNSKILLELTRDSLDLIPKIVFAKIPDVDDMDQMGIAQILKINAKDFFNRYREFDSMDQLIQTGFEYKLKEYGYASKEIPAFLTSPPDAK
ncbi:hypothetical protein FBY04_103163 [Pseudomonas sp. SJZ080]|uniref:hypothetical protein n=1 Tax=Pseudomonas sp. SJZ080 TaxID=2572888 RepID=UPI00119C12BF|nr:hypothetical protein [Pseudomonas sp. SJZ080]TWC59179.1 hypothetical protein FBY04_103163 [Pseudomonas sp. SJZ080]